MCIDIRSVSAVSLLVASYALVCPAYAVAETIYYLSPTGNDNNSGTTTRAPWKTTARINAAHFGPGDTLLIDGGNGSVTGCITFAGGNVASNMANPFTVGVYNGTKWRLNSNCGVDGQNDAAVTINSISGITIQDGVLSGNGTHTLYGIEIENYTGVAGGNIVIQRMDISDFNTTKAGVAAAEIYITAWSASMKNVQILNNTLHGLTVSSSDDNGINGWGYGQNITATYSGNTIYYIGGHPKAPSGVSGNGIWSNGTSSSEIANNYIHDIAANMSGCGGPVGIGTYNASNAHIHDNEIAHVHATTWSSSSCDFAALDADGMTTSSLWERNYTNHNDGPAFEFGGAPPAKPWSNNTFRLNISEEDNLQNTNGGGIWALSPTTGGYVYNNTAYRSLNSTQSVPYCVSLGYNGTFGAGLFANNVCTITASMWGETGGLTDDTTGHNQSALTIMNNDYYLAGRQTFWWRGTSYKLSAFQAATGEDANSVALNPMFAAAGAGGNCGGIVGAGCPSAYKLAVGSPMVGKGAILSSLVTLPTTDYYGALFHNRYGYNMGVDSTAAPGAALALLASPSAPGTPCGSTPSGGTQWVDGAPGASSVEAGDCRSSSTWTNQIQQICTNGVLSNTGRTQAINVVTSKPVCSAPKT